MVTDELSKVGADIFEDFKASGGDVEGIEHIIDPEEAAKVRPYPFFKVQPLQFIQSLLLLSI
jgi:hypothetical protein